MLLKKLKEEINIIDSANRGIFYNLHELLKDISGYSDSYGWLDNYTTLDLDYYLGHSGDKYLSPLYMSLLFNNKTESDLATIILNRFGENWKRKFEALNVEYAPLDNYSMEEEEKVNSKVTVSTTSTGDYKGFNIPNSESGDDYAQVNKNGTESTSSGDAKDNVRNLQRHGNIGVTTNAQMLTGELEVRQYDFIQSVMNDIDSISLLMVY